MASTKAQFKDYLRRLTDVGQYGDATEESFYGALSQMSEEVAKATGRPQVHVTTLPKSTDAGNPDFRLWNGADRIVGYIEAKKPAETHLDQIEESKQLRRYRSTFPNLILTNFLEFRLYRNGDLVDSVLLARPYVLNQLQTAPPVEKPAELAALLDRFLDFSLPVTFTAASLAVELAKRTRFPRERGCPLVVLVGHPEYYPRFGFERASALGLVCPWDGVPDEAWMACILDAGVLEGASGLVRVRDEWGAAV